MYIWHFDIHVYLQVYVYVFVDRERDSSMRQFIGLRFQIWQCLLYDASSVFGRLGWFGCLVPFDAPVLLLLHGKTFSQPGYTSDSPVNSTSPSPSPQNSKALELVHYFLCLSLSLLMYIHIHMYIFFLC